MLAAAVTAVLVGSFSAPTYVTARADVPDRIYVTEKAGLLRVVQGGAVQAQPALDISALVESGASERGLLSAAFIGDRTYVYFTAKAAAAVSGTAGEIQVREYPGGRMLLAVEHSDNSNHNGGQIQVAPDGSLWVGTGDGGGANDQYHHAQDPSSRLGKLIRLDPAGGDPVVLARGLRNPWRFSFADGVPVIADVGQGQREEIDVGLADNYGWPCFEGTLRSQADPGCDTAATKVPVLERPHAGGVCSITGGYVVRDPGLPSLLGRYVYGDYCAPALRSVDLARPETDAEAGVSISGLSSFGEDACGRVYTVSLNGPVSRLQEGAATPCGAETPAPVPTATPAPEPTAAPALAPAAGPPPALRDRRACAVSLRVTGLHSVARRRFLSVALRADEPCRATISAPGYRVATARLEPRTRTVVRLRTGKPRRGRLAIRVQAVDADGNVARVTRRLRVHG